MEIKSLKNEKVKFWTALSKRKKRKEHKRFIVEGEHLVEMAVQSGLVEHLILINKYRDDYAKMKRYVITDEIASKISSTPSPQGIFAVCVLKDRAISKTDRVLILDNVSDPGNLGTLMRTALAFGYDGLFVSENTVDPYSDKVLRSSQGAIFKLPIMTGNVLDYITELKSGGVTVLGTALKGAKPLNEIKYDAKRDLAVVLGNEGSGIGQEILEKCDLLAKIEIENIESLNVAIAGGIIMYCTKK